MNMETYNVPSDPDPQTIYIVTWVEDPSVHDAGEWHCTCPAFRFGSRACKHIGYVIDDPDAYAVPSDPVEQELTEPTVRVRLKYNGWYRETDIDNLPAAVRSLPVGSTLTVEVVYG